MERPILYTDCDGVIYDTIETAFQIMRENNVNMSNSKMIDYYFREKIDWNELFSKAMVINESIDKIKKLNDLRIFRQIIIFHFIIN